MIFWSSKWNGMDDGQQNVHKHSQHFVLFLLVAGLRPLCRNDHAMRKIQIGKCWETRTKRESPSDIMHPQRNARFTCMATDHIHVLHVQWHSLSFRVLSPRPVDSWGGGDAAFLPAPAQARRADGSHDRTKKAAHERTACVTTWHAWKTTQHHVFLPRMVKVIIH